jgi:hypothetical protein
MITLHALIGRWRRRVLQRAHFLIIGSGSGIQVVFYSYLLLVLGVIFWMKGQWELLDLFEYLPSLQCGRDDIVVENKVCWSYVMRV